MIACSSSQLKKSCLPTSIHWICLFHWRNSCLHQPIQLCSCLKRRSQSIFLLLLNVQLLLINIIIFCSYTDTYWLTATAAAAAAAAATITSDTATTVTAAASTATYCLCIRLNCCLFFFQASSFIRFFFLTYESGHQLKIDNSCYQSLKHWFLYSKNCCQLCSYSFRC